jgi:hypothetical protein
MDGKLTRCAPEDEDPVGQPVVRFLVLGQTVHQGAVNVV